MGSVDHGQIRSFFSSLYGDSIGENGQLVLWSTRDKRSHWVSSIEEAADRAEALAAASDLYFGVCLQDRGAAIKERMRRTGDAAHDLPAGQAEQSVLAFARGYASTVAAVPGIWLDVDIAGEGHEKRGLPRSGTEAWKIVEALPFPPTLVVRTGGGFHAYWLFHEPWVIESEEERAEAAGMVKGWQTLAIDAGANLGYSVDSTHDLARVLRPLGTVNHKYGTEVCLRPDQDGNEGPRYNPSDFENWASAVVPVGQALPEKVGRLGEITGDIQPPAEKLLAMLNLVPQFAATWNRERKEFPSQSEYDLSLASMAIRAGWSDDEVVALVIAHRRTGGEKLKLDRPEYYARLIGKARSGNDAFEAHERIEDRVEAVEQGDSSPEDERAGFLRDLSALLGFPIRRVLKYVTDPPQYRLVLDEGTIHLGGVETILNSAKFRAAIAAVSGRLIQRFGGARWDPVAQAILQSVEELDLGVDSSAEGLVGEWLGEYLAQHRPSEDRAEAIPIRSPFVGPDGAPVFFLSEFRSWLGFHRDERLGRRQIATILRSAGCKPKVVGYTRQPDGHSSTVHVWEVTREIALAVPSKREIPSGDGAATETSLNGERQTEAPAV